jgi:CubicO group peptidase (beta-lactamase class C family)
MLVRNRIVGFFLLITCTLLAGDESQASAELRTVQSFIQKTLVEKDIPSLAVAVARNGEIIWEEAWGMADRENQIPATPHTMYSLASISKPITATAIMILVERGLINLDSSANNYLGSAKLNGHSFNTKDATVRRLMNHTSGLPLHYQFFYEDEPYRRPPMDLTIMRYGNLVTKPGERYQYSNLGYGVLDYIIERTSGRSYSDFMRNEVFLPLGLNHTTVDIGPGLEQHAAVRYNPEGESIPFYDFDHPGASAVFASAHDLVRFGMFHLKNKLPEQRQIITSNSIDLMAEESYSLPKDSWYAPSKENGYGLGWNVRTSNEGLRIVRHSGGMGGVRTELTLFPDENVAIVILCNGRTSFTHEVGSKIIELLFPKRFEPPSEITLYPEEEKAEEIGPRIIKEKKLYGTWSGVVETYNGERKVELIIDKSGYAFIRIDEHPWSVLNEISFKNNFLNGEFHGDLGTNDVNRVKHRLRLDVKFRRNKLNGSLIAVPVPEKRVRNALTHWVELKRINR